MDYKAILGGYLTTVHNKSQQEVYSLLDESKTEAELKAVILSLDADRISSITAPLERKAGEQKDFGWRKSAEEIEGKLKAKTGVDKALKGDALIDAIAEKLTSTATLPEDQVKVHPLYRNLQESVTNMKTEHETALNELKTGYQKEKTFAGVKDSIVWPALTKAGYIMPANQNQANILKNQYEAELAKADPETQADGKVFAKLPNGEYAKDSHQNVITYDVYATSLAGNYFDLANNNGGASPNNANNNGAGGGKVGKEFKTAEELSAFVNDKANSLEDRTAAQAKWLEAHPE